MIKTTSKMALLGTLREANDVFRRCSKRLKILSTLSWGNRIAQEFFSKGESVMPKVEYAVDQHALRELEASLNALSPKLKGEHPVLLWLSKTQESYILGTQLLMEVGKESFYEISTRLYGNPASKLFKGKISNLDLADSISKRMSVCNLNDISEAHTMRTAEEFAQDVEKRIKERRPALPVRVELTDEISAKVVSGMSRIRIRRDARFSKHEIFALWNHEIESHSLTANNGVLQENCDFLCSGGPRTTMTQEGLAVFFEMYGHSLSQRRFLALCDRVYAVQQVEQGANFLDLYRWYKERSDSDMDAFFSASRIFRGTRLDGKYPFTKDVVYIGGLLGIFNFLQIAVKNQNRLLVESLICGRIALEDVGTIAWLRTHGILSPPKFLPSWLENWEALLSFFSFSAFINAIDLNAYQDYFDSDTIQDWDMSV